MFWKESSKLNTVVQKGKIRGQTEEVMDRELTSKPLIDTSKLSLIYVLQKQRETLKVNQRELLRVCL